MAELIAKRYGNALYDLAVETGKVVPIAQEVKAILNVFKTDVDFLKIMNHPHINNEEKFDIIQKSFGDNLSSDVYGFFNVVFAKNRETEITSILEYFLLRVNEYLGVTEATIVSAVPFPTEKIELVKQKLAQKLKKEVNIVCVVDESLIGGMLIKVDGLIIDGTISHKIASLKKQLYAN